MSCLTDFCQQKRLPLFLGKYHLSANLSTALQIFVLFHKKSNFYFRNTYLPLSMCICIPLYIQYLAGIFQTQPLKQQKGVFFNPYVSLANNLYPSILGRKKLADKTPVPFSQTESAGDCYFCVAGRQLKRDSGLALPTPPRRNGGCSTESTASSQGMVGHTQSCRNNTLVRMWPEIPNSFVQGLCVLPSREDAGCPCDPMSLLALKCLNGHSSEALPLTLVRKLGAFHILERLKKKKKGWLNTSRLYICRQYSAIRQDLLLKTVRTEWNTAADAVSVRKRSRWEKTQQTYGLLVFKTFKQLFFFSFSFNFFPLWLLLSVEQ